MRSGEMCYVWNAWMVCNDVKRCNGVDERDGRMKWMGGKEMEKKKEVSDGCVNKLVEVEQRNGGIR